MSELSHDRGSFLVGGGVGLAAATSRGKGTLRRDAALAFAAILAGTIGAAVAIASAAGLSAVFPLAATATYLLIAAIALRGLGFHPHARFGAPNVVTAFRAGPTALLAALAMELAGTGETPDRVFVALFSAMAFVAVALDGIDGYLARRLNLCSRFGARFDMEIDALLILALSVLAFQLDKAGAWILAAGLVRYVFVAAALALPMLRAELPPTFRRKAVCAAMSLALCAMLVPAVPPALSSAIGLVALTALLLSFLADILWLRRNASSVA